VLVVVLSFPFYKFSDVSFFIDLSQMFTKRLMLLLFIWTHAGECLETKFLYCELAFPQSTAFINDFVDEEIISEFF
jgi:hypothetical protein